MIQPAFTSWQENSSNKKAEWMAIAAGGVFLGAGSVASCERGFGKRRKTNAIDPMTFPTEDDNSSEAENTITATSSSPKDPMTVYAKYAVRREMEGAQESQSEATVSEPKTQATSPARAKTVFKEALEKKYMDDMTSEELRIEEATRKAKQHSGGLKLFSGNGNMALSLEIARHLGINLGKATVGRFADGEANVVINENVRGKDVYVIQPTCPPVNDNIMELLLMVSTLRRASARRITVVIPYYGYARQDRKMQVNIIVNRSVLKCRWVKCF